MLIKTIKDTLLNFNMGMLSFVVHRVAGLALTLYLVLHIFTLSSVVQGAENFDAALGAYDNPIGHVLEFMLLLGVLVHGLNGLRVTAVDFFEMSRMHRSLTAVGMVVLIVVAVVSFEVFLPGLIN
jgi:succinate dehydrogenase cytochrome b subunit